jgi:outer membrane protein
VVASKIKAPSGRQNLPTGWGRRPSGAAIPVYIALLLACFAAWPRQAAAETIEAALARACENNPQLNAQRAIVRQTDEGVPQALSGYRPTISATATVGRQYSDFKNVIPPTPSLVPQGASFTDRGLSTPHSVGGTVYMDMSRDSANLEVQQNNVRVLDRTLTDTRNRFAAGQVTSTDVAQSEAQLAAAEASLHAAESTLMTTRANYRRIIGVEPANLAPASAVDRLAPSTLGAAIAVGTAENPSINAALYGVDVAQLQVKIAEGALWPTLAAQYNVQQQLFPQLNIPKQFTDTVMLNLSVPLYQGGAEYSAIRLDKETLDQQRLNVDQVRDQTRANVVQAWGQLQAARAQVDAAIRQNDASERALTGVRNEAMAGQRTTQDVLNAEQALVNARQNLLVAQHDRVVASYSLLSAVGRLSAQVLALPVSVYDPSVHYRQVRDSWIGMRTPGGQ